MGMAEEIHEGLGIILNYITDPEIRSSECEGLVSTTTIYVNGTYPEVMGVYDVDKLKELNWTWHKGDLNWVHDLMT